MFYFNVYTENNCSFFIFFGFENNDNIVLADEMFIRSSTIEPYMDYNFNDFNRTNIVYNKEHNLSFKEAKTQLKEICKKLIVDGFVFSEQLGEIGYEELFPDEGGDFPNPIFLEEDFI